MPEASSPAPAGHEPVRIGLVSVSDRASSGVYEDKGIPALRDWLGRALRNPIAWETRLIPDDAGHHQRRPCASWSTTARCDLVLTTGGTGPAPRDVTPEATLAVADKEMPGFGEQMRQISLRFVPTAILSRQVAVIRGKALIINLPGQPKSIAETLEGLRDADAAGARHLRRGAVLHRPDRRPLPRDRRGGVQGLPAEVGDPGPPAGLAPGGRSASLHQLGQLLGVEGLGRVRLAGHAILARQLARARESFSIACQSSAIWCSWPEALSIRPFIACDTGSSPCVMP